MTTVHPHQALLPPHPQLDSIPAGAYDNGDRPSRRWVDHSYAWHPECVGERPMPADWPTLDAGEFCPDCGLFEAARTQEHQAEEEQQCDERGSSSCAGRVARGFRNRENYCLRMLLIACGLTDTRIR